MHSHLYHLQVNINFSENHTFYAALMQVLGWQEIFVSEDTAGYKSNTSGDLWFVDADKHTPPDYDAIGLNHIAIRVDSAVAVDEVQRYIEAQGIKMLFGTPVHRPEFADKASDTYYQIMFESPDRILFEIVYIGPR